MTERSARFALPFILPGQAQKDVFHNEALATADALLHAAVESSTLSAPPTEPEPGQCWLVGSDPSGAWAGRADMLAFHTSGGWRFSAPTGGMSVWDKAAGIARRWSGSAWSDGRLDAASLHIAGEQVVGARLPAVPSPSGGSTIDAEARAAVTALIVALQTHGLID